VLVQAKYEFALYYKRAQAQALESGTDGMYSLSCWKSLATNDIVEVRFRTSQIAGVEIPHPHEKKPRGFATKSSFETSQAMMHEPLPFYIDVALDVLLIMYL
jgi:hypothetical protein